MPRDRWEEIKHYIHFNDSMTPNNDDRLFIVNWGVVVAIAQPVSTVEKWDRKLKKKMSVECPSIISLYNKFMGGVDATDALIIASTLGPKSTTTGSFFTLWIWSLSTAGCCIGVIVNHWISRRRSRGSRCPSEHLLHKPPACGARTCPRRRGDVLHQIWKESSRIKDTEAQPRPYHHRQSAKKLWVTSQWLKVHGSTTNSQTVGDRLCSSAQRAMFTCDWTKVTTASGSSMSKTPHEWDSLAFLLLLF